MQRGKRWAVLIVLGVLLVMCLPVSARSPRAARAREDLSPSSVSGRPSDRRDPASDFAPLTTGPEELGAASALLMDADTGAILLARNHKERRSPALHVVLHVDVADLSDGHRRLLLKLDL